MNSGDSHYHFERAKRLMKRAELAALKEGTFIGILFGAVVLGPEHLFNTLNPQNLNAYLTLGVTGVGGAAWAARRYSFHPQMYQQLNYLLPLVQSDNPLQNEFRTAAEQQCRTIYAATLQGMVGLALSFSSVAQHVLQHTNENPGVLPFALSLFTLAGAVYYSRQSRKHGARIKQLLCAPS